jgi:hypothetical protein
VVYINAFQRNACAWRIKFEKAQSLYDEITSKITDKRTFFESSKKEVPVGTLTVQYRDCLIIWQLSGLLGAGLEEF